MHPRRITCCITTCAFIALSACDDDPPAATPPSDDTQPDDTTTSPDDDTTPSDGDTTSPDDDTTPPDPTYAVTRLFPTDANPPFTFQGCTWGSPQLWDDGTQPALLLIDAFGVLTALHPDTGQPLWTLQLPTPEGQWALQLSKPVLLAPEGLLIVTYMTTPANHDKPHDANAPRLSHRVAVVDLRARALSPDFPPITLDATAQGVDGEVRFRASHYLTRPDLAWARAPEQALGSVYVTGGNTRDLQPWHGWAFEVNLDAWRADGPDAALTGVLITTPEVDSACGPFNSSGSRERKCGGGLWSPSGPLVVPHDDGGYHLILSAGNGQLDLARSDFANTLLKVGPGLGFDPACDPDACADFNPDAPAEACAASCANLFIPRLLPDQSIPAPANGACDGLTLFECWQALDYIGGSTPIQVTHQGRPLLVYPAKDGSAFLIDGDHLGLMHDRHVLVETCGANPDDPCRMDWAGMAVTQPLLAAASGDPLLLIPTFMPDRTHDAGVVALSITGPADAPRLTRRWEFPTFGTPDARARFRSHPSRMALSPDGALAWVVEVAQALDGKGTLIALHVSDGQAAAQVPLAGRGQRFTVPLTVSDRVYIASCDSNAGPAYVEGYQVTPPAPRP